MKILDLHIEDMMILRDFNLKSFIIFLFCIYFTFYFQYMMDDYILKLSNFIILIHIIFNFVYIF